MASVREDILAELKTTISTLLVGSGGYTTNLGGRVYRMSLESFDAAAHPFVVVGEPDEVYGAESTFTQLNIVPVRCNIPIFLWMHGLADGTTLLSTNLSSALADLQKAVFVDRTRGGKAVDTFLVNSTTAVDHADETIGFCGLTIQVLYRFRDTDPTVAA